MAGIVVFSRKRENETNYVSLIFHDEKKLHFSAGEALDFKHTLSRGYEEYEIKCVLQVFATMPIPIAEFEKWIYAHFQKFLEKEKGSNE